MSKTAKLAKKILPAAMYNVVALFYHWAISRLAALYYRNPSKHMVVIGVTGTNGKSTTVHLLHDIFSAAGLKTASISSIRFRVNGDETVNSLKMTMPSAFTIQKFLRNALRNGCTHAIIEVTSEGIKQFRHNCISFDTAVLTNVTKEHIESHGSFEKYREAKRVLFYNARNHVLNGDDKNFEYFNSLRADIKLVYRLKEFPNDISLLLEGDFNKMNALAAIKTAELYGIPRGVIKSAIEKARTVPGRLEYIQKEPFSVIVDYAHTPDAQEKVYETLKTRSGRLICVFGATGAGGGRDTDWKRPEYARIAENFCDSIYLTNDEPYDEDPWKIITDIENGFSKNGREKTKKNADRALSIKEAILSAGSGDVVIITGLGSQMWMSVGGGRKIPWDDRKIAREALGKKADENDNEAI